MTAAATHQVPVHEPDFWRGDFWADLAHLRRHDPVHRVDTPAGHTFWALTRHADVMAVSRDPQRWRSGGGILIDDQKRRVTGDESLIYLDPPDHARHRKLVSGWFKPSTVRGFEARVRQVATELLDGLPSGEVVDLHEALAVPLPIRVIAEMLGVPAADQDRFRRWSDLVIAAGSEEITDETTTGMVSLLEYFRSFLDPRRRDPGHDLISDLVAAELDGEQLTDDEMLGFCLTLLVAGNETTRNLLANGAIALAEHPDQYDRLAEAGGAGAGAVATAVEELLRWVTPVIHFARTATEPTTLGEVDIPAGGMVVMLYPSANRDEDVFGPTADRLDLTRDPNPHVAFGFGEHFCLGAQLARLEARVLLEELVGRVERLEVAGPVVRRRSNLMRGIEELPMRLVPRL